MQLSVWNNDIFEVPPFGENVNDLIFGRIVITRNKYELEQIFFVQNSKVLWELLIYWSNKNKRRDTVIDPVCNRSYRTKQRHRQLISL